MTESPESGLLSRLERAEARLLAWGVTDGSFTAQELRRHAGEYLATRPDLDPLASQGLIDALVARKALLPDVTNPDRYRTRMAETIRLSGRLRQIFPGGDDAWRTAPTLVADYRMALRERRYPRRDLDAESFISGVAERAPIGDEGREALAALLARKDFRASAFQIRSTAQALSDLSTKRNTGIVVASGTGSGKTLAFYLPALTWTATVVDDSNWTKVLAIYPRIELIKDQIQTAFTECRRLDSFLNSRGRRKMTIAALFGGAPLKASAVAWNKDWIRRSGGYLCPVLRCPHCGVGDLMWSEKDRSKGHERLTCIGCQGEIQHDEIILTRDRMKREPPDILFTSTEMLNKEMSNDWNRHLFGLGPIPENKKPRFLLLDEIHVNQGTPGAQTGYLIRRWRSALRSPVTIVGLSATLLDARGFFADLVGLNESDVTEVSPNEREFVTEGMEYSLALRGDPTSGTSLLSTTIQTAMLMRRMLDTPSSAGAPLFGQRVYAFTDQLDAVNRLYWNLLDAEGWARPKTPLGRTPRSLASLRSSARPHHSERALDGQSWDSAEEIGHSLSDTAQKTVSRTTSQDSGVTSTDIVVATASLEVGFDDPSAAVVIQHKAPRQAAQFIQRKGRAGRLRGMRPWTIVVLSDYGRDRTAYQSYETLFDPKLTRQVLPLANRYVLRMQSGFALLEWLGARIAGPVKGSIWTDAARPADQANKYDVRRQRDLRREVEELMSQPSRQLDLAAHLTKSLQITLEEAQAVLWESPRALMTELLPTLHRRLVSGWRTAEGTVDRVQNTPLPEFLPANLFSDLLVPDVQLTIPIGRAQDPRREGLGIVQALTELCPGRASKRFAVEYQGLSHWLPVPVDRTGMPERSPSHTNVSTFADTETLGIFQYSRSGGVEHVICLRPLALTPDRLPGTVKDTTMARPTWHTQIVRLTEPPPADLPNPSSWAQLINSVYFHLHVAGHQVAVRRFYDEVEVDLKRPDGSSSNYPVQLVTGSIGDDSDVRRVAFGFETEVDAIRVQVDSDLMGESLSTRLPESAARSTRSAWFDSALELDRELPPELNTFQRSWLSVLAKTALVARAEQDGCDLPTAHERLREGSFSESLITVLNVTVGAKSSNDDLNLEDVDPDDQGRLYKALHDACNRREVITQVDRHLTRLYADPGEDADFADWQRRRALGTLGSAFVEAMGRIDSQLDIDSLNIDTQAGPTAEAAFANSPGEIWISESTPGGAGLLEEFHRAYAQDPKRFWRIVAGVLQASDAQDVDVELGRILRGSLPTQVPAAFQRVRDAYLQGQEPLAEAHTALRAALASSGIKTSHSVMSALSTRLLRPGSNTASDEALRELLNHWDELQSRLRVDVAVQSFAYIASGDPRWDGSLNRVRAVSAGQARQLRYTALIGLLWPRGGAARTLGLARSNRFQAQLPNDPLLVLGALSETTPSVMLSEPDWRRRLADGLTRVGEVDLVAPLHDQGTLQAALLSLLQVPSEIGYLLLYPRLVRVSRSPHSIAARLELRESMQ